MNAGLQDTRPKITVSADAAPLGSTVELRWEFTGNPGRINELTISFEGREEATYRRGTNTRTDKNIFRIIEVMRANDPFQIAGGEAKLVIPADTMHSFKASNNKILWRLKVAGDIPHWPDVAEEFEFTVLPAPPAGNAGPAGMDFGGPDLL
jgi:hypothetical protein